MEKEVDRPIETEETELELNDLNEDLEINLDEEDSSETITEEVDRPIETEDDSKQQDEQADYTKLLENFSKDIKFMDEEIKINSIEELKELTQKGLNHEKLSGKLKELENGEEVKYIREKAKNMGMTPSEYIAAVKEYEKTQLKEQEEQEINEMVENGIALDIGKKVVETNRIATELKQEKLRLAKEKEEQEKRTKQMAEYDLFLEKFPDVKINEIPKDVFREAQKTNLITAYIEHLNNELKKENKILKQNKENKNSSPVGGTTEHGGSETKEADPFIVGFDSDV